MQGIDARGIHRVAGHVMGSTDSRNGSSAYGLSQVILGFFTVVNTFLFVPAIVTGETNLANGPTLPFTLIIYSVLLVIGLIVEGTWRLSRTHNIRNLSYSRRASDKFDTLLPHNKEIARPVIQKMYAIERGAGDNTMPLLSERAGLMDRIVSKDKDDRKKMIKSVDRSDIEAAESILHGHSMLEA